MGSNGTIYIISGPSGVGKGTLVRGLLSRVPNLHCSISSTTRKPRSNEEHGKDYFFLPEDEFRKKIGNKDFLEWAEVCGYLYGTSKQEVETELNKGNDVVLEIDVQGALKVMEESSNVVSIIITPPSFEELEKRLCDRLTESESEIADRMKQAEWELLAKDRFQYNIVNDSLDKALERLVNIVKETKERG